MQDRSYKSSPAFSYPVFLDPGKLTAQGLRAGCLCAALVLYGLRSSPTPDEPGVIEGLIGLLLIGAAGGQAVSALDVTRGGLVWLRAGRILLVFGLCIPLLGGIISGHEPGLVMRDIAPFLFLMLPVVFYDLFDGRADLFIWLRSAALFAGLCFALRDLAALAGSNLPYVFALKAEELTYLANSPLVLFAALFCAGRAMRVLIRAPFLNALLPALIFAMLAGIAFVPIIMTLQRASLAYAALYLVVIWGIQARHSFYRACFIAFITCAVAATVFAEPLFDAFWALYEKTESVGVNRRFAELQAVWAEIRQSGWRVMFGTGWGGTFESPAVGGVRVNFTHSLLTSTILKTGLSGLILMIFYLWGLGRTLALNMQFSAVFALALLGPFLIDIFLYAAFKSLDFGVILLLITGYALSRRHSPSVLKE